MKLVTFIHGDERVRVPFTASTTLDGVCETLTAALRLASVDAARAGPWQVDTLGDGLDIPINFPLSSLLSQDFQENLVLRLVPPARPPVPQRPHTAPAAHDMELDSAAAPQPLCNGHASGHAQHEDHTGGWGQPAEQAMGHQHHVPEENAWMPQEWEDREYFQGYGKLMIHVEMLRDAQRMDSYFHAITSKCGDYMKGKVVLDVGCGTGILSCFCCLAGARKVYGVEASDVADHAETLVRANNMNDVVQIIKGRMEDVELPGKVDLIVSEWMGCVLFFESMAFSVVHARDKWLKPDGFILPTKCRLWVAGVSTPKFDNRYPVDAPCHGVDLSVLGPFMRDDYTERPFKQHKVRPSEVITTGQVLKEVDMRTATIQDMQRIMASISITTLKAGSLSGFVTWFDVLFHAPHIVDPAFPPQPWDSPAALATFLQEEAAAGAAFKKVTVDLGGDVIMLSTSPLRKSTHWKQDLFLFDEALPLDSAQPLFGVVKIQQNYWYRRHIDLEFNIKSGKKVVYKHFVL